MISRHKNDLLALTVLAGIILVVFGTPIALGRTWLSLPYGAFSDLPSGYAISRTAHVVGVDNFSFPHLDWPARIVAREAHVAGELSLWNPHAGLGVPLVGQYQTQPFFPLEMLELFLGLDGWQLLVLLRMFVAGMGAYVFLACVSAGATARLTGALFYAFSAFFLWFCSIPAFTTGAMLVPWLFWAAAALLSSSLAALRVAARVGLIFGLMLLSGQPQLTVLAGLACAVFVIFLHVLDKPLSTARWLRSAALSVLALVLAFCISAPQTVSFLQANRWGSSLHTPGAFLGGGTSPLNFTISLWPYLLGQPMQPWNVKLYPEQVNWEGFPVLLGASGLLLGLLGTVTLIGNCTRREGGRPPVAIAMMVLSAMILAVPAAAALGYPIWNIERLDRINFPRYITPVLSLGIATLVAFALDRLASLRRTELVLALALSLLTACACYVLVHPMLTVPKESISAGYFWHSIILGLAPFLAVAASLIVALRAAVRPDADPTRFRVILLLIMLAELGYFVRYGFDTRHELWRLSVVFGVCVGALCLTRFPRMSWVALGTFALAPLALMASAERSMPYRVDPSARPSELARVLQGELGPNSINGRMTGTQNIWTPNFGNVFGVAQLESLAPMQLKGTAEVIFKALTERSSLSYAVPNSWPGISDSPAYPSWQDYVARRALYNLLGVRVLLDNKEGWLSSNPIDDVVPVWRSEHHVVYRDNQARARAYLVAFPEPETAFAPELDRLPRMDVIEDVFELAREHPVEGDVQVRRITPGSMHIDIRASKPALLVVADAYYPGWTAVVDGKERRVARVAGALRGVFVRPEDRRVELQFRQMHLHTLLWLSLGALALAVVLTIFGGRLRGTCNHAEGVRRAPQGPAS